MIASAVAVMFAIFSSAAYGMYASALRSMLISSVHTGFVDPVLFVRLTPGSSFSFGSTLAERGGEACFALGAISTLPSISASLRFARVVGGIVAQEEGWKDGKGRARKEA